MLQKIRSYFLRLNEESLVPEDGFLCSVFLMCKEDELEVSPVQFDFYHSSEGVMTSYRFEGDELVVQPKSQIFNDNKKEIIELNLNKDLIDFDQVYLKAKEFLKIYNDSVDKLIIILQCIDNCVIWNITFLTPTFNMFNVKINAETLEVIKKEYSSLLSFKKEK
jgi:hypothetical protein